MGLRSVVAFLNLFLVVIFGRWLFHQVLAQQSPLIRGKRALYFPTSVAIGVGVALAIPLDNGRGDVFVSYCLESNYNLPTYSIEEVSLDPPPFTPLIVGDRQLNADADVLTSTTMMPLNERKYVTESMKADSKNKTRKLTTSPVRKRRMRNSFISRKKFYQMIENKMMQHGLNGRKCLLRTICEANLYDLGALNGVLGDFVHIMFSPSTSKDENLPKKNYVAELRGRNGESCEKAYGKDCPNGIFELITTPEQKTYFNQN